MPRVFKFDLAAKRLSEETAYPQDALQVWSSAPYPLTWADTADTSADLVGGLMRPGVIFIPPEETNTSADLVGGEMRQPLRAYAFERELTDTTADLVGGELRVVLKTYALWPPEPTDTTANLVGGELKRVLITYGNWALAPDTADTSANLISGYLGI
jgi:hypothetical protein